MQNVRANKGSMNGIYRAAHPAMPRLLLIVERERDRDRETDRETEIPYSKGYLRAFLIIDCCIPRNVDVILMAIWCSHAFPSSNDTADCRERITAMFSTFKVCNFTRILKVSRP